MPLRVYSTLTRTKEPFETVRPGQVGMYVCGPTVYINSHVGHMVGPVIFDAIKRYLQYSGYQVTFVVNITDVDDKLIDRAQKENTTVSALAQRVTDDYLGNLRRMGVDSIDHLPRATEHIPDIINITQGLIKKGFAYPAGGDVYFDVTKDPDYGKLSHRNPEELQAGARIEPTEHKRHPGDFALWKAAKPGEPAWDSPWGKGRPGWHIECSAMAMRYLGESLDIHGGGLDLVFPHHENEVAQSESYTGKPFARYWLHNGLMQMTGDKMSKSKGNLVTITDLLARHDPETVRFFLLSTHYRRPIDFSDAHIEEVGRGLQAFYRFFERYQRITGQNFYDLPAPTRRAPFDASGPGSDFLAEVSAHRDRFLEAMDDDFNTGGAVGVLFELLSALNRFADNRQLETTGRSDSNLLDALRRAATVLRELANTLGVFRQVPERAAKETSDLTAKLLDLLVALRNEARASKDFALADQVRKRLADLGVTLEDRAAGTGWRIG